MTGEVPVEPVHRPLRQREVLSEEAAQGILARAAELDAAQRAAIDVARLRAAAVEAGISPSAFDSALAELHGAGQSSPALTRWKGRRVRSLLLGSSALAIFGAISLSRLLMPPEAVAQEAFRLRCLTSGEAFALVRPVLGPAATMVAAPGTDPRVITIRSKPEQMSRITAVLHQQDGAACATTPAPR